MTSVGLQQKIAFQRDAKGKLTIFRKRKGQLVVSYQIVTEPCCSCPLSLAVSSRI